MSDIQTISLMDSHTTELAERLGQVLLMTGKTVSTAESCTGGGIAEAITRVAGSSQWFGYGWVTYANNAKQDLLGVTDEALKNEGAVSAAVVEQMAAGARQHSCADIALAVSGVAGPDGGSADKPVGTVYLGWATAAGTGSQLLQLQGDRLRVRSQTVAAALSKALELVK